MFDRLRVVRDRWQDLHLVYICHHQRAARLSVFWFHSRSHLYANLRGKQQRGSSFHDGRERSVVKKRQRFAPEIEESIIKEIKVLKLQRPTRNNQSEEKGGIR